MKIKIIQIGKNKDDFVASAMAEYLKRTSPFFKIETITLKESKPAKTVSFDRMRAEEAKRILKTVNSDDFVVALDEKGAQFTSTEFAGLLKKHEDAGTALCFIIGGYRGLSPEITEKSDLVLSFSKMTFTHQMIRVFLLEQIYRAACINCKKEYHIA